MNAVTIKTLKAENNCMNSFLADEDKIGDQVLAQVEIEGKLFTGSGNTQDEAFENLKERVDGWYSAKAYIAKVEIDKANGQYYFD